MRVARPSKLVNADNTTQVEFLRKLTGRNTSLTERKQADFILAQTRSYEYAGRRVALVHLLLSERGLTLRYFDRLAAIALILCCCTASGFSQHHARPKTQSAVVLSRKKPNGLHNLRASR